MGYALDTADAVLDPDDEPAHPAGSVRGDAWAALHAAVGFDETRPAGNWLSLVGALHAHQENLPANPPGRFGPSGRDRLRTARDFHIIWYAQQAWALLEAVAGGGDPVKVPPVLPADIDDWEPPAWQPPDDADTVVDQLPDGPHRQALQTALGGMRHGLARAAELDDWRADIMQQHSERGCDDEIDGGWCGHEALPAEYEMEQWADLEDQAASFVVQRRAFCAAVRDLVNAHVVAAA